MNPIAIGELVTGKLVGYACEKCRMMCTGAMFGGGPSALESSRERAEECCVPKICEKHDREIDSGWTICPSCRSEKDTARDLERWMKAAKVPLAEYPLSYVYRDGHGNDGYIDVSCLDEEEEDSEGEPLGWAWGCASLTVSAEDVRLSRYVHESVIGDNHHEDAGEHVDESKIAEAEKLIVEACKNVESFVEDNSVVVILREGAGFE